MLILTACGMMGWSGACVSALAFALRSCASAMCVSTNTCVYSSANDTSSISVCIRLCQCLANSRTIFVQRYLHFVRQNVARIFSSAQQCMSITRFVCSRPHHRLSQSGEMNDALAMKSKEYFPFLFNRIDFFVVMVSHHLS